MSAEPSPGVLRGLWVALFEKRSLPLFLTPVNKYPMGIIFWSLASYFYLWSNHNPIFTPRYLTMTGLDRAVPFIPHTVYIYISEYLYFPIIYMTGRNLVNLNKYLWSFLTLQSVSVVIFLLWPTIYPRELFPLPSDLDAVTNYVFTQLRIADAPTNCAPSLHVSTVYLSAFIFLDEQRKKFPLFFTWGTLIAFSTLPTKQHYFIDIVSGFGMAVLAYWFMHRVMRYHWILPTLAPTQPPTGAQAKR